MIEGIFLGKFAERNKRYINETLEKTDKLYRIPKNILFFFLSDTRYYNKLLEVFPKEVRKDLKEKCIKNILFNYSYKNKHVIVFNIKKGNYVYKNKEALIGDLLHEISHIKLRINGLDEILKRKYKEFYLGRFIKIKNLPVKYRNSEKLFDQIGSYGILLLKDLYCNTELINKGLADYVFYHYYWLFKSIKSCPKPVFYDKFKLAVKENPQIMTIAFEFEFIILSAILPLQKFNNKRFEKLIVHLHKCYELNVADLARKCKDISERYLQEFPRLKEDFPDYFFLSLFNKVYDLLS